jgi:hypothetical protein
MPGAESGMKSPIIRGQKLTSSRRSYTAPSHTKRRSQQPRGLRHELRSDAAIVGSNPTQGMDVWCVYAFILCLCCPEFR